MFYIWLSVNTNNWIKMSSKVFSSKYFTNKLTFWNEEKVSLTYYLSKLRSNVQWCIVVTAVVVTVNWCLIVNTVTRTPCNYGYTSKREEEGGGGRRRRRRRRWWWKELMGRMAMFKLLDGRKKTVYALLDDEFEKERS